LKNWQLFLPPENYFDNPFEDYEDKEFTQLPLREKVKVLHQLCEYRLEVNYTPFQQCFRFTVYLDPDGIWIKSRSVDPDPEPESGFRRAKNPHKNGKKLRNSCVEILDVLF
jgi:hypothetical protein